MLAPLDGLAVSGFTQGFIAAGRQRPGHLRPPLTRAALGNPWQAKER